MWHFWFSPSLPLLLPLFLVAVGQHVCVSIVVVTAGLVARDCVSRPSFGLLNLFWDKVLSHIGSTSDHRPKTARRRLDQGTIHCGFLGRGLRHSGVSWQSEDLTFLTLPANPASSELEAVCRVVIMVVEGLPLKAVVLTSIYCTAKHAIWWFNVA